MDAAQAQGTAGKDAALEEGVRSSLLNRAGIGIANSGRSEAGGGVVLVTWRKAYGRCVSYS